VRRAKGVEVMMAVRVLFDGVAAGCRWVSSKPAPSET
jgi:hypothetical protein